MSGRADRLDTIDQRIHAARRRRDSAWYAVGHDWAYSLQYELVIDTLIAERAVIAAQ